MTEFVVNMTLILALMTLLLVWAASANRSRRRDRREHAQERRLILGAFTAAAGGAPPDPEATDEDTDEDRVEDRDQGEDEDGTPCDKRTEHRSSSRRRSQTPMRRGASSAAQQLDPASIGALLDLLEDRRPARRGVFAGLFSSPGTVWSAGTRAGQSIARNTMGDSVRGDRVDQAGAQLYREAAGELVDIYAHDPADARAQYVSYATAVGEPALAALYVRSAAYATYADHLEVAQLVEDITNAAHGPELSDDIATIDT